MLSSNEVFVTLTWVAFGLLALVKGATQDSGGRERPYSHRRLRHQPGTNQSYPSALIIMMMMMMIILMMMMMIITTIIIIIMMMMMMIIIIIIIIIIIRKNNLNKTSASKRLTKHISILFRFAQPNRKHFYYK